MSTNSPRAGFTLLEILIAMSLVGLVMTMTGLLFHRSFRVLRTLDEKERTRQASRMGVDRITTELREATKIVTTSLGRLEFEKINPNAVAVPPEEEPENPPDNFVKPLYTPMIAYPSSARLNITYRVEGEALVRDVRSANTGVGSNVTQPVVEGVNSFICTEVPDNAGELDVRVTVVDGGRVLTVSSRVLCPCICEEFQP